MLFRSPWELYDARERGDAKALVHLVQQAVSVAVGMAIDNTSDLARILRVPGTWSRKYDPPRPVQVVGGTRQRYEARDLHEWAAAAVSGGVPVAEPSTVTGQTKGRNDACKAIVAACIERGESVEYTVGEVLRHDAAHHSPPLFSDPTEAAHKTPDPAVNALAFVSSIAVSLAKRGPERLRIGEPEPVEPIPDASGHVSAFHRWDVRSAFVGAAPPMQWLVERVFPYGVPEIGRAHV